MFNKEYLYNQKRKYERIKNEIESSKREEIPGSLVVKKIGPNKKYYHAVYINNKQEMRYIPKENIELRQKLTQKKYYRKLKPTVDANLKILNYAIKNHKGKTIADAFYS